MQQHSGRDDKIVSGGIPHVFALVRPIKRIAVSHLFAVAENILTVDSPVGKTPQNLLELLSQPPTPRFVLPNP
jgi:hypothetical protein